MNYRPLLTASLLTLAAASVQAQSLRLTDDAGVVTTSSTPNGVGTTFNVKGKPSKAKKTLGFLKFDLADLPAGTLAANVSKATLRVFVNAASHEGGTFDVQAVTGAWTEDTITGTAAPALGAKIVSGIAAGPEQSLTYVSVDVTTLVQQWVSGALTNDGLALVPDTNVNASFDTKENALTGHPATLEVTLVNGGPAGPAGPQGVAGAPGATGPAGPQGPEGSQSVEGSGSAGPKIVAGDPVNPGFPTVTTLSDNDTQYTDFTVQPVQTLIVPSGTVIRCTGNFINLGTIIVAGGAPAGIVPNSTSTPRVVLPGSGLCNQASANGNVFVIGSLTPGESEAAIGIGDIIKSLTVRGPYAGGGGGSALGGSGGAGGGAFAVIAKGQVINNGAIEANGAAGTGGGGGGAGGLIVLMGGTGIPVPGALSVEGGAGGPSTPTNRAGGGGAGGVIHLVSSAAITAPAYAPGGGAAGSNSVPTTATTGGSGAAGGSFYGSGGFGAASGSNFVAGAGDAGKAYVTQTADPTTYFFR